MTFFTYNTTLQRGVSFRRDFVSRLLLSQSSASQFTTLGSKVFTVQSGLTISVDDRVRAYSISEPTNFVEGPVSAYTGTNLTVTVDSASGDSSVPFTDWQLLSAEDLTGASIAGEMRLSPNSCAGRNRTPVSLTVEINIVPLTGKFYMALTDAQTTALTLGDYDYFVVVTYADTTKRQLLRGTITVEDLG